MNYSWGERTENDCGCEVAVGTEDQESMQCHVIVVREVWCLLCSVKHDCTELTMAVECEVAVRKGDWGFL